MTLKNSGITLVGVVGALAIACAGGSEPVPREPSPATSTSPDTPVQTPATAAATATTETAGPPEEQPTGQPLPEPEVVYYYYPEPEQSWPRIPSVTVLAADGDPRIEMLTEAIAFWNAEFAEIGTPFRLGAPEHRIDAGPPDALRDLCANFADEEAFDAVVRDQPGDIVVVLSDIEMSFSCSTPLMQPIRTRTVVIIRDDDAPPMSIPGVTRQVIAHELGHSIGLGHNNDPTKLMCGLPADCKLERLEFSPQRFLGFTVGEIEFLRRIYPPTWTPTE